jgi:hypothetical protein
LDLPRVRSLRATLIWILAIAHAFAVAETQDGFVAVIGCRRYLASFDPCGEFGGFEIRGWVVPK